MAELFGRVSPEKAGVSSRNVIKYIEHLKKRGVVFHSLMLLKGNDIFCEAYGKKLPVYATGGAAPMIIGCCKQNITLDEHLVLKGLHFLYQKNK